MMLETFVFLLNRHTNTVTTVVAHAAHGVPQAPFSPLSARQADHVVSVPRAMAEFIQGTVIIFRATVERVGIEGLVLVGNVIEGVRADTDWVEAHGLAGWGGRSVLDGVGVGQDHIGRGSLQEGEEGHEHPGQERLVHGQG